MRRCRPSIGTYTFDSLDRLLTSSNRSAPTSNRSCSYNDAGSIATSWLGTYTYPLQWAGAQRPHTPLSIGGYSFGYDANGNLTNGYDGNLAPKTLVYDGDNRLVSVVQVASTTTYAYGPDGSRIKTVATVGSAPAKTSYLLGSSELDDAGVLTKIPNPDIRKVGSTLCYVHRDHLASVKLETDASGGIAMRQRFTAFGQKIADPARRPRVDHVFAGPAPVRRRASALLVAGTSAHFGDAPAGLSASLGAPFILTLGR